MRNMHNVDLIERLNIFLDESSQLMRDKEIAIKQLKPRSYVNGITRARLGILVVNGDFAAAKRHVREGVKKHGRLRMQDAVRNELMEEFLKARRLPQAQKIKAIENIKKGEALLSPLIST